ncbi:hypothetical protein B5S31_g344 [[Candida] boidinii]|nr:hypothetical protein B5S29_g767 [[Candida] boidinii]OWB70665.1 hypothetical protein B5S31_g344 [[Candida] boidinii]GME70577.1 unnamed protein product [[Candida] boidinii]
MFSSFGGGFQMGGPVFGAPVNNTFDDYFRCYPISMMPEHNRKDNTNYGGKIFLPQSALHKLSMLNVRYPMLFKIDCSASGKSTHSGVLEFTAEEGRCYLPQWMLNTIEAEPGTLVNIKTADLAQGSFVKLEPQSVDFLDISDPKAVLENALRFFTTLTVNDIVELNYNDHIYKIKILEVKPDIDGSHGICVIETDLETDFAPPVGYVEPDYKAMQREAQSKITSNRPNPKATASLNGEGSMARQIEYGKLLREAVQEATKGNFDSEGVKLSGKKITATPEAQPEDLKALDLEGPSAPLHLPDGQLFFGFPYTPYTGGDDEKDKDADDQQNQQPTFVGQGNSLRTKKKRKDKNKNHPPIKDKARSPETIEID